jgi:FkbM family methyltransferase
MVVKSGFLGLLMRKLRAIGGLRHLGLTGFFLFAFETLRQTFFPGKKPFGLRSKNARFRLLCRPNTSDFTVFRHVFIKRQYGCLDRVERPKFILDCGANIGYSAAYFLTQFPEAVLTAVEPDADNCAILEANLCPFAGRYRVVRAAIWPHETGLTWDETPYRDGREWARVVRSVKPGEVPLVTGTTISALMRESQAERISILKMDIERSELALFSENFEEWLDKVDNLAIELHDLECASVFNRAIANQDFKITRFGELTICQRSGREVAFILPPLKM